MNTLKFRAWDGKRITTSGIMFNNSTGCLELPQGARMKLMQFTGLKDRNDKEIYEGDIVKCGYGVAKVIFNAGCFMIEWLDDREAYMEFVFSRKGMYSRQNDDEKLEIIGNIHENPELLNQ